jgi:hypothetical protein
VAVFTATIPQTILKKIWSEVQSETTNPTPPHRLIDPDLARQRAC